MSEEDNGSSVKRTASVSEKSCWVCFITLSEDETAEWVQPCKCKGTCRWVHQRCLQRWVDEKQKGNANIKVTCPQCGVEYNVCYPDVGVLVNILDWLDRTIQKVCPFAAAGVVIGSVYWDAVTYGAVTIMQLLGHKEGLYLIEHADPSFMFFGLPTIPVLLTLGQMLSWETYSLRGWRKIQQMIATHVDASLVPRVPAEPRSTPDPISASRTIFWAMVQPTTASVCGNIIFSRMKPTLQRTILGGIIFMLLKGVVTIFYRHQHYLRQAHRVLHNHPENNPAAAGAKSCWICFGAQADNPKATFLCPCKCQGATKWVHQRCLHAWIDDKQRGNGLAKVTCAQCNTDYIMTVPDLGRFVRFMDMMHTFLNRICPFAALGMLLGFLYWNAVTFGAVTVMQILGHKEGLNVMESADPLFLLLGLPTIPMVLTIAKLIPVESYVLSFWRKYSPYAKSVFTTITNKVRCMLSKRPLVRTQPIQRPVRQVPNEESIREPLSATRVLCGVLVFPTIATLFGKMMFSHVDSNVRRTILGGLMFSFINSGLNVYLKEKMQDRQAYRIIKDYKHPKEN